MKGEENHVMLRINIQMEFMLTDKLTIHYTCQPAMICDGWRGKPVKVYG